MRHAARPSLIVALVGGLACEPAPAPPSTPPPSTPPSSTAPNAPPPSTPPDARPPAPWMAAALPPGAVPPVYVTAWRAAENRSRCALLAPMRVAPDLASRASPRAATFSGGWGVAYDLPGQRSAFGVAGTGARAWDADVYDGWPVRRELADGSRVGYGPEDASETNWLAYVRIPGQDCLYNVWSRRGQAHLEALLGDLRFVAIE